MEREEYLQKVDDTEDKAVAAEGAVTGRVHLTRLCPVLDQEYKIPDTRVDAAIRAQEHGVLHGQAVLEGDVALQSWAKYQAPTSNTYRWR
jgi:hypothetical protein